MRHAIVESASASGFRSAEELPQPLELTFRGELPGWLRGRLIHTGPALWELPRGSYEHWFDGLAMLGTVTVGDGVLQYRSRFLRSEAYCRAREEGRPVLGEFGTRPPRGPVAELIAHVFPPHSTDNANVNVVDLGGRVIAMTESSRHVELDLETLETRGELAYDDDLEGQISTAHPHVGGNELHNLLIDIGRTSAIQVYSQQLGTVRRRRVAAIETAHPPYTHSFAATENFIVLTENPLLVNPLKLRFSTRPYFDRYDWRPERGMRIRILRKDDGRVVASAVTAPHFVFHHANAFERDGWIDVDVIAYPDSAVVRDLTLEALRTGKQSATGRLLRLSLRADALDQRIEPLELVADSIELPRLHPGWLRRANRYLFAVGRATPGEHVDRIVKVDLETRTTRAFGHSGWYFDEPVVIPSPGGTAEDDAIVVLVALDTVARRSRFVVLDGRTLDLIGEAELPQIVPFFFHNQWLA